MLHMCEAYEAYKEYEAYETYDAYEVKRRFCRFLLENVAVQTGMIYVTIKNQRNRRIWIRLERGFCDCKDKTEYHPSTGSGC